MNNGNIDTPVSIASHCLTSLEIDRSGPVGPNSMRTRATRLNRFQIVERIPMRPNVLGRRRMRPSIKHQSRAAGMPCALGRAAAAFDALTPRLSHSARRERKLAQARSSTLRAATLLIDRLHAFSRRATVPVSSGANRTGRCSRVDTSRESLEQLKEIERLDAYVNALSEAACVSTIRPVDAAGRPYAPMDMIETYVDVVRKAQGKRTYADLNPDDADFEAQLDDFVADVFRAMGASPRADRD
jgi:hypothetical protein